MAFEVTVPPSERRATGNPLSIVLVGAPNSGKTTLFNRLTGLHYKVANYPGTTVERREGSMEVLGFGEVKLVDLPGTYSLFGQSIDELVATSCLYGENTGGLLPDILVAVIDASNLERNLYLTTQLIDFGRPIIVALNMIDIAERRGIRVRSEILARQLGCPVVPVIAKTGEGIEQLRTELAELLKGTASSPEQYRWCSKESPFFKSAQALGKAQVKALRHPSEVRDFVSIGAALLSGALRPASSAVEAQVRKTWAELVAVGVDPSGFEAERRYYWIEEIIRRSTAREQAGLRDWSDAIDRVLTHRVWGMVVFTVLMGFIFQAIFSWASVPMDAIDQAIVSFGRVVSEFLPEGQFRSLVVDGVIAGVGSVLIFLPQIAILYFFIGLLEDSGYLARAAFLMDKVMRKFGLQGRSFIPLLSSFACAIPGIMSARVIPSFADRMATILVAPLMSCSARLPVYTLLIAAFVPERTVFQFFSLQALTLFGLYFLGVAAAALVAFLLKITILRGQPSHLVMEMPPYHLPSMTLVFRNVLDRLRVFVRDAGTVILSCTIILWFLASFPRGSDGRPPDLLESYAGRIGRAIEPVIAPLGFDWRIGVSLLASFAAREVFVSSMATVNQLENADEQSESLISALRNTRNETTGELYDLPVAFSLMVFYCFACQCMSTLAVCRRETGNWRWPAFMFAYMTALAYLAALLTYQVLVRLDL